jgi:hypothetical protein
MPAQSPDPVRSDSARPRAPHPRQQLNVVRFGRFRSDPAFPPPWDGPEWDVAGRWELTTEGGGERE